MRSQHFKSGYAPTQVKEFTLAGAQQGAGNSGREEGSTATLDLSLIYDEGSGLRRTGVTALSAE